MTIAYVSAGTLSAGTTSLAPAIPASLATGDGVLIYVTNKADTAIPTTPVGWTLVASVAGGGGTTGNSAGPTRGTWFFREKTPAWSTMPTITITGATASAAQAYRLTKSGAMAWALAASSGVYGTSVTVTNAAVTTGSDPGLTVGDFVMVGYSNQSAAPTWSAQGVSATGATFAAGTEITEALEYGTNPGVGGMVYRSNVTAGTATVAPTLAATASTATRGTAALVRLREQEVTEVRGTSELVNGSRTTHSVPVPGTVQPGDLVFVSMKALATGTVTPPAAFTLAYDNLNSTNRLLVFWKRATAADSGTYDFTTPVAITTAAVAVSIAGRTGVGDPSTDTQFGVNAGSTNTVTLPAIQAATGDVLIGFNTATGSSGWTPPAGTTEISDTGNGMSAFTTTAGSAGLLGPLTSTYVANAFINTWGVTLKVAPPGPVMDASSPPTIKSTATGTFTTAAFSPPANSAIIVGVTSDQDTNTGTNPSVTDNTGGKFTWSLMGAIGVGGGGDVGVVALLQGVPTNPSVAPGSMTLTVNVGHNVASKPKMIRTSVYTSDQVDITQPIGQINYLTWASGTARSADVIPVSSGGGLRAMYLDWNATGVPTVLNPGTTVVDSYHNAGLSTNVQLSATGSTVEGVPKNIGVTLNSAATDGNMIAYELRGPAPAPTTTPITASDSAAITITDASSTQQSGGSTPIVGAESTAISIAETTALTKTLVGSETTAISIAETTARFVTAPAADSAAVSVSEASVVGVTISTSDASAISIAESTSITIANAIIGTESTALGLAETTAQAVSLNRPETVAITITETSNIDKFIAVNDPVAISVGEVAAIAATLSRTDTAAISVSDTSASFRAIVVSDTSSVAATETTAVYGEAALPGVDSGALGIVEQTNIAVTLSANDSDALGIDENATNLVSQSAFDGGTIIGIDTSAATVFRLQSATDGAAVSVAETRTIASTLSRTDTSAITVTESTNSFRTHVAADSAAVSVAEQAGNGVTQSTTDDLVLVVTETVHTHKTLQASDNLVIELDDDGGLFKAVDTSDTISIAVTCVSGLNNDMPANENTSLAVVEQVNIAVTTAATDSAVLALDDRAAVRVDLSVTDGGSLVLNDTGTTFHTKTATDGAIILVAEVGEDSVIGAESTTDTATFGMTEVAAVDINIDGSDEVAITVMETVDIWTKLNRADSPRIGMTESRALLSALNRTDDTSIAVTETASAGQNNNTVGNDAGSLVVSETSSIRSLLHRYDGGAVSLIEEVTQSGSRPGGDNLVLSVQESNSMLVIINSPFKYNTEKGIEVLPLSVSEQAVVKTDLYAIDSGAVGVVDSGQAVGRDANTVLVLVYQNGEWTPGTMMVYRAGRWRVAKPHAYKNGAWYSD